MNRPIKYRGKQLDNGEMIYGFYAYKAETDEHFIIQETISLHRQSYFTDYKVDPETVGQYTGLTDILGKEIYEQDICSCPNKEMIVVICYDINQTRFKAVPVDLYNANAGNGGWTGYEVKGYFEVIGSIYTHPHLLEVSNG